MEKIFSWQNPVLCCWSTSNPPLFLSLVDNRKVREENKKKLYDNWQAIVVKRQVIEGHRKELGGNG